MASVRSSALRAKLRPLLRRGLDLPAAEWATYSEDGLQTNHGHAFTEDPRFVRAYDRAVRVAGADWGIRWRIHTFLWAVGVALDRPGAFVECGTGRGVFMSAACTYFDWTDRPVYLFDTFLPTAPDESGDQAKSGPANPYYAEGAQEVADTFAEWPAVQLVEGRIPDSLSGPRIDEVAFLHLDLNHAKPEESALRHFWPLLTPGAVVVFDDYGFQGHEAQRAMADRLGRELGFAVLASPTGQGLVVKPR